MKFLDFLFSKNDSGKEIGSYEVAASDLVVAFTNLAKAVGASNPGYFVTNASKTISLKKKNDKYVLRLLAFNPPIEIEWTGQIPMNQLAQILDQMAAEEKNVSFINSTKLDDGQRFFQLAVGR